MVLFFGTALMAQQHAVKPELGREWLDYLWRVLLVSMVVVTMVSTPKRLTAVVTVAALSLGFHATKAGLTSLVSGGVRYEQGLGGAFEDNNGYAMAVVMILPLLVASAFTLRVRWAKWVLLAAALPSTYTVISTYSRAGFLALVCAVLTWVALSKRPIRAMGVLAVASLLAWLVVPIPKAYLDRLQTIQTYEEVGEESAMSRIHFWRVAVDMVRSNPYGVGLRNFDAAYDRYDFSGGRYGRARSVHSSHFQVLAETGFMGFALWAAMFGWALFIALRARRRASHPKLPPESQQFYRTMANALIISMVGFLVGGAFIALALNDLTWLTFGLVASLDRLSRRAIEEVEYVPPRAHVFVPRSVSTARMPVERPAVTGAAVGGHALVSGAGWMPGGQRR
jgi:probable O-glycosylation ligase (exosortase A-associated)